MLGWVLHDWSDATCLGILKNVYNALSSGGTILISESIMEEDSSGKQYAEFLSLLLLMSQESGARERSRTEFEKLLTQTGFQDIEFRILKGPRDLIIACKP